MKELNELKECMLRLTEQYGHSGNNQKRNLWNAYDNLEKRITEESLKKLGHDVKIIMEL